MPPDPPALPDVLAAAFALLESGAAGPGGPWRNLTLATVGTDLRPKARTIVLRGFDAAARCLELHTDCRSAKFAELRLHPVATLHGWDAGGAVQLRASGAARLHVGDHVALAAWTRLRPQSQATYRAQPGPGTVLPDPDTAGTTADDAAASAVFCVIRLRLEELEWLHLAQGSHRRARFRWQGDDLTSMWLVP